ncbi:hypothetical protein MGWOODY_Smn233 [hydrothermal vent metagenome]|uniref:Uncharacterized protein n=1 Tax=hydrothermal vent metagenome TaxID=652676 RepID=A0A160TGT4_9ZZZZ
MRIENPNHEESRRPLHQLRENLAARSPDNGTPNLGGE